MQSVTGVLEFGVCPLPHSLRSGSSSSALGQKIVTTAKSHKVVDDFISGLSIIPIYGCSRRYATEKVRLRKPGKPMNDEFDLLIAVTSVENKLTLVTDNVSDFQEIEGIKIENWFNRK